jgi:hypothetical protein
MGIAHSRFHAGAPFDMGLGNMAITTASRDGAALLGLFLAAPDESGDYSSDAAPTVAEGFVPATARTQYQVWSKKVRAAEQASTSHQN